jgi:hypothetical protein
MGIPNIPMTEIHLVSDLPLAPFALVLLLKLNEWEYNRRSPKEHLRSNQSADAHDIDCMLLWATAKDAKPLEVEWLPASFISDTEHRIV